MRYVLLIAGYDLIMQSRGLNRRGVQCCRIRIRGLKNTSRSSQKICTSWKDTPGAPAGYRPTDIIHGTSCDSSSLMKLVSIFYDRFRYITQTGNRE